MTIPWLGEPTEFLLPAEVSSQPDPRHTFFSNSTWQPIHACDDFLGQEHFASCWKFETTESNKWWGVEDSEYSSRSKVPRSTKNFLMDKLHSKILLAKTFQTRKTKGGQVDIMEIYSPPRVTQEASGTGILLAAPLTSPPATTLPRPPCGRLSWSSSHRSGPS